MSDSSPQIGPKRALIRSPVTNRDFMPRLSWRGSLFVWPEGELGELSHPPPACPGGTPRAMNEVCQKYLGPKIPKAQGFAVALLAKAHRLFRFLAGDHYGKGKSIRDEHSSTYGLAEAG